MAEAAAKSATRLRPDAGETHLARADLFYRCYLDYDRARPELALARAALPNNAQVLAVTSFIDRRQSRWDDAVANIEHALELDPRNWYYLQQLALSYHYLRRYADEAKASDRVIEIVPGDPLNRISRASLDAEWKGDLRPLRSAIDAALKQSPSSVGTFDQFYFGLALYERDILTAEKGLAAMPPQGIGADQVNFPVPFWRGMIARMQGDTEGAQKAFLAARAQLEPVLREQPDWAAGLCALAMADAGLGNKQQAIDEGRGACELLPVSKDAVNGIHMMEFLAVVYAWTGEKELAVQQLQAALSHPSVLSYGQLKLHPYWDPLRGDPGFEAIVNSLAPK
jgi:serine/threonine-protein kinase